MLIIGNQKDYLPRFEDVMSVANTVAKLRTKHEVVLAPSHVHLSLLRSKKKALPLAAQDVSVFEHGAHTGEISATTLRDSGVSYVIIGHSERRSQGEDSHVIATKLSQVLRANLSAVLCIGESSRDAHGGYLSLLREQITSALSGVSEKEFRSIVIAYEPVWAIGKSSDEAIDREQLEETMLYIRKIIKEELGEKAYKSIRILYGGSVAPENIEGLLLEDLDGFLVGRGSTSPSTFKELIQAV